MVTKVNWLGIDDNRGQNSEPDTIERRPLTAVLKDWKPELAKQTKNMIELGA